MWPRVSDGWENRGASETSSREKPAHLWDDTASVKTWAALATSDMINNRPNAVRDVYNAALKHLISIFQSSSQKTIHALKIDEPFGRATVKHLHLVI